MSTNDAILAAEQERQKGKKINNFTYVGARPTEGTTTKFGVGRVSDVIICFKFYQNLLRGFQDCKGRKWGFFH